VTAVALPVTLAYLHGDDGYGIDAAADGIVAALEAATPGIERWRVSGEAVSASRIEERVTTGTLFGGGTAVVVRDPAPLVRTTAERDAVVGLLGRVADGNALVFTETIDGSGRRSAGLQALQRAVGAAGGLVRELKAPREGALAAWIEARAGERAIQLGRGAARELAERVGGFVREGDVDRRDQGRLAVGELEKLALYRAATEIQVDDVRAIVAEAVPASSWAFLDAVAGRHVGEAAKHLDRLLASTPELVLVAQLHRVVRELIIVADLLGSGSKPTEISRLTGLKSYPAQKRSEQARRWTLPELEAALGALVELDATVRGAPGFPGGDEQRRTAFMLWLAERVARQG
jgi:DNA polymerase III delta subunit